MQARFEDFRHHVLATLRTDGSPRLTGLEADFREGELWLGMMIGSRKALDLRRDPRFSLHANPGSDSETAGGDVRVSGRAVEVTDADELRRWASGARRGSSRSGSISSARSCRRSYGSMCEDPYIIFEVWHPGPRSAHDPPENEDSTLYEVG